MPEVVSRPGAVISTYDAAAVVAGLSHRPDGAGGVWRVSTSRWELCSGPGADANPIATIDLVHNVPYPHAAMLTRVSVTETALAAGLDPETVCDRALLVVGKRLADCPRSNANPPPVFTGRRRTERGEWTAATETAARPQQEPEAPENSPATTAAGSEQIAATAPDPSPTPALDSGEDRELRRLHFLTMFGGLASSLAERYTELRRRDRRSCIREPHDDDLVVLPKTGGASGDRESVSGVS